jgi:hypothetical protein
MSTLRKYTTNAERQKAYRQRHPELKTAAILLIRLERALNSETELVKRGPPPTTSAERMRRMRALDDEQQSKPKKTVEQVATQTKPHLIKHKTPLAAL